MFLLVFYHPKVGHIGTTSFKRWSFFVFTPFLFLFCCRDEWWQKNILLCDRVRQGGSRMENMSERFLNYGKITINIVYKSKFLL